MQTRLRTRSPNKRIRKKWLKQALRSVQKINEYMVTPERMASMWRFHQLEKNESTNRAEQKAKTLEL